MDYDADFFRFIRARHESVNERLQVFGALRQVIRHDRNRHSVCFHADAQIVQVSLLCGEKLVCADN